MWDNHNQSHFNVVLVEDDVADMDFFKRVIDGMVFKLNYRQFDKGEQLLSALKGRDGNKPVILPDLIFLDINLPGINGKEILKTLKSGRSTNKIPVLVMSGSNSLRDFKDSVSLGANGYIVKNSEWNQYKKICESFIKSWALLKEQKFV